MDDGSSDSQDEKLDELTETTESLASALQRLGRSFPEVPDTFSRLAKALYREHGPRPRRTPNRRKRGSWRLKMRQYEKHGRQE